MSVFLLAVPALLVVVLGYSVGYTVWDALGAPGSPEPAGWATGLVLLVVVTWLLVSRQRRLRRRLRRARARGDAAEAARLRAELSRGRRRSRS
ncbi:hypothetical protein DQ238_14975 [Geodermatophilus sp. TF02-6]|uniref:hypothetical protein n=1 Tax=Geodermatophilus sp. TF02-6 TaxID=2250575 RepID=UPI000DE933CA|nr:hypothetical protein [Geodermatophilus sp. TF02-6]RBY77698.1 hypothetical protein DQ238_14975 [Geodermatophilus sp. TF02-6]